MTPWIRIAGWTLVHFVWEGAVIALLAAIALRLLAGASARARYGVACAALAAMLAAPIVTASLLPTLPGSRGQVRIDVVTLVSPDGGPNVLRDRPILPMLGTIERTMARPQPSGRAVRPRMDALLPFVVLAWLTGVVLLLARLAFGWSRVHRLHSRALGTVPSGWRSAGERIARRLSLRRYVHIIDSWHVDTPTVIGWLRPVVLLPVATLASLSPSQIEAILAHELAHIRRHDYLVNLLQTMAETLLFYHPGVWWISARIRDEREHCCDDVAVAVCGNAVDYAAALTELEASRAALRGPLAAGRALPALAATGGSLVARVRRVLGVRDRREPRSPSVIVTAVLIAGFVFAGGVLGLQAVQRGRLMPVAADAGSSQARGDVLFERRVILRGDGALAPHEVIGALPIPQDPNLPPGHFQLFFRGAGSPEPALILRQAQDERGASVLAARQIPPPPPPPIQGDRGAAAPKASGTARAVLGTVRDARGAIVPGASVVLNDLDSAATRTTRTGADGRFSFVDVAASQYVLDVTTPWAEPIHDRFAASSGDRVTRDVILRVRGLAIGTRAGSPSAAAPLRRALPGGWSCVDDMPGFCGPPSLVAEWQDERRTQLSLPSRSAQLKTMLGVAYPQTAWDSKVEGTAVIEGRIGANGIPTQLHSTQPVYPELAATAIEAVAAARFEPAQLNGVAVDVPLSVTVEFRLHP